MGEQTVHALIEEAVARWPDAVYAQDVDGSQSITFAQLRAQCLDVAHLLQSLGSAPGDTVSLVMPNGLQTLRLLLGAMHGGWCVNPVNLLSQPEQMRYVLDHSDCRVIFASPEWAERVRVVPEVYISRARASGVGACVRPLGAGFEGARAASTG